MRIIADYHTHTTFSHGKGSVEDNVLSALKRGFREIAITDHGLRHVAFGLRPWKLRELRAQVDALNKKYAGAIRILMGVEANLVGLDGRIDIRDDLMPYFDIVLMGYHRMAVLGDIRTQFHFAAVNPLVKSLKRRAKVVQANTLAFVRAMERYPIACITHPSDMIGVDLNVLGEAAARTGTALELNMRHTPLTPEEIGRLKAIGAAFMINSDAHRPENVGDFEDTVELALSAGLNETDVLNAEGCVRPVRLPPARA